MTVPSTTDRGLYAAVTKKIVAMIEDGLDGTYKAPWHSPNGIATALPMNATTHAEYSGINVLSLWIDARQRGYSSPLWASYRQWRAIGAQVRKGERGSMVVFYKRVETQRHDEQDDNTGMKLHFLAKASFVFNAAQVDGFEPDPPITDEADFERIVQVEAFVGAVRATVRHGYSGARYRTDLDAIEMPQREWFVGSETRSAAESYYAVLLHELTHWSGAPHRLNRQFGKRFGDNAYAFEELVAELGAAFMCAAFSISSEPRPDHAAYVASWLRVLCNDPRAIFTAASKAQEAFEHLAYLATRQES